MFYEIMYDQDDSYDIREIFEGTWTEMQAYTRDLRRADAYHISAQCLTPEGAEQEAERLVKKAVDLGEYARRARLKKA